MKVLVGASCLLLLVQVSLACNHAGSGCDDLGHGNCNTGGGGGGHGHHGGGGGHHGRALTLDGKDPAGENTEEKEDKLCADKEVIGQLCLAGTAMGEKMKAALDTCINIEVQVDDMDRKRKTPKGKGKNKGQKGKGGNGKGGRGKCPTAGEIMERIDNQTSEHRCVLKEMGWVDAEGKVSLTSEVAMNDLKSLHPSVLENMAQENIKNCHKVYMDDLKKTSLYKKCKNKYSEEDESKIKEVISNMIFGKCSKKIFMKSCSKYVADSFMSFMESGAIQN